MEEQQGNSRPLTYLKVPSPLPLPVPLSPPLVGWWAGPVVLRRAVSVASQGWPSDMRGWSLDPCAVGYPGICLHTCREQVEEKQRKRGAEPKSREGCGVTLYRCGTERDGNARCGWCTDPRTVARSSCRSAIAVMLIFLPRVPPLHHCCTYHPQVACYSIEIL